MVRVPLPPSKLLTDSAATLLGAIKATVYAPDQPFRAATTYQDGTYTLVVGPQWLDMTDLQRVAALDHEAGHIVGAAFTRVGNRDPRVFNIAHDLVINHLNPFILEQLPNGVKFADYGLPPCPAEVAYEWLLDAGVDGGGCGRTQLDDQDTVLTDEQHAELAALAIMLAASTACAGTMSGCGRALPDDLTCPPWVRHLIAWLDAWELEDGRQHSYARESRREVDAILLPSWHHESSAAVQVNVDGSGSMPDAVLGYVCAALRTPELRESIIRAFDVDPQPPVPISAGLTAIARTIAATGGGTAFLPVAAAAARDARRLVWITDGQSSDGWPPVHPSGELWLCTTDCIPPTERGRVIVRI